MKRFLGKLSRFFCSRGFLKFVLWTITFIVLFYAEEDWRGAYAWATMKAKWEARGKTLDFDRLIPPPVPDAQNLAALPLFKMEMDSPNGNLEPLALQRALRKGLPGNELPVGGLGMKEKGEVADLKKIRASVATAYLEAFPTASTTKDTLTQFEALYPFVAELRAASASRPSCRFEQNYRFEPPYNFYLSLLSGQISVARILTIHAILALDAHQPDIALEDVRVIFKLAGGLREQPTLVSGLCSIGVTTLGLSAVYEGLSLHAWDDSQLAGLQRELVQIDFLASYQRLMQGEALVALIPFLENERAERARSAGHSSEPKWKHRNFFPSFWPDGWIDSTKARGLDFDFTAAGFVDPKARLVLVGEVNRLEADQNPHRWPFVLWDILYSAASGPVASAVQKTAESQVMVDEARVACALERYRLAHGGYPASLDPLVPACLDSLPHDIMDGQPYRYRVRSDSGYLLYSVGWNQTDDGGKIVYEKDSPRRIDYPNSDWVWLSSK